MSGYVILTILLVIVCLYSFKRFSSLSERIRNSSPRVIISGWIVAIFILGLFFINASNDIMARKDQIRAFHSMGARNSKLGEYFFLKDDHLMFSFYFQFIGFLIMASALVYVFFYFACPKIKK